MSTISQSILQLHVPDGCFHHAPGRLLQVLTRAGGSDNNNVSYPHEDASTLTGRRGNCSGASRMTRGRNPDCIWETGGEKETKETKIEECQISGVRLIAPLMVLDTHL